MPATAQVDFDRWLDALARVETANRPAVRGAAGELSAWQITAPVWRVYTRAPFAEAQTNPRLARLVPARMRAVSGAQAHPAGPARDAGGIGLPLESPGAARLRHTDRKTIPDYFNHG